MPHTCVHSSRVLTGTGQRLGTVPVGGREPRVLGIVACEQAVEAIGNVIGDLDMALVFAAAGQLDPVDKGDHFSNYKQTILDGSRDLTNDAKGLVAGATGTQDQVLSQRRPRALRPCCCSRLLTRSAVEWTGSAGPGRRVRSSSWWPHSRPSGRSRRSRGP